MIECHYGRGKADKLFEDHFRTGRFSVVGVGKLFECHSMEGGDGKL